MSETTNPIALPVPDNYSVYDFARVDDKDTRLAARSLIDEYEKVLQEFTGSEHGDRDEINEKGLAEYLVGGAYIRQLFIPKDTTIVSRLWNKDRFWIIAAGDVSFRTEMGAQRVVAPYMKIVAPGSKVALYTHEDTLWFAITGAKSETLDKVKAEVTSDHYDEIIYPWEKQK